LNASVQCFSHKKDNVRGVSRPVAAAGTLYYNIAAPSISSTRSLQMFENLQDGS
jgi:hypothetical protein